LSRRFIQPDYRLPCRPSPGTPQILMLSSIAPIGEIVARRTKHAYRSRWADEIGGHLGNVGLMHASPSRNTSRVMWDWIGSSYSSARKTELLAGTDNAMLRRR
jgi:hypothetical protein